jgi:hypothetical protein
MELSKQKGNRGNLYDPYRKEWVAASPEEMVRQKLLHVMTSQLHFPKELLAIEIPLGEVPHLKGLEGLPKRRADIICFAKGIHPSYPLYPLLIVECKEGHAGGDAKAQALGYNHFVDARFVAVAGEGSVELIFPQPFPFLPSYPQLMEHLCK